MVITETNQRGFRTAHFFKQKNVSNVKNKVINASRLPHLVPPELRNNSLQLCAQIIWCTPPVNTTCVHNLQLHRRRGKGVLNPLSRKKSRTASVDPPRVGYTPGETNKCAKGAEKSAHNGMTPCTPNTLLTKESPSRSWNERFIAGTSAAQIPDAPALLPGPNGGSISSFGSIERLLRWDTKAVERLLRPM